MKTDRHFVFPSVCLFCLRLANCIMKMSINFPTICRQKCMSCCIAAQQPHPHTHTDTHTHTPAVACHSQCQLQIEFICWRQILTWQTHFYFILFAFLFHSLLTPHTPAPTSIFFSIFMQLHLCRLVPWPSPKTFANHVFAFISSSALPAPDVPLPRCIRV